jgi:hypothetical protein
LSSERIIIESHPTLNNKSQHKQANEQARQETRDARIARPKGKMHTMKKANKDTTRKTSTMSNLLTASPLVFPIGFLLFFHCSNILAHLAMTQISIPRLGLAEARHSLHHRHDVQRIASMEAGNTPELAEPGIPLVVRKQQAHYTAAAAAAADHNPGHS